MEMDMPLDLPYFPRPGYQLLWLTVWFVCVYTLQAGGLERQVEIRRAFGDAFI